MRQKTFVSIALLLAVISVPTVFAAVQEGVRGSMLKGKTTMSGSVIASSCSLSLEDRYQVVDLGDVALRDVLSDRRLVTRDVFIRLNHCWLSGVSGKVLQQDSAIRVRFDGMRGHQPDLFGTAGMGGGLGLRLRNARHELVRPGEYHSAVHQGKKDELLMKYQISLVPDGEYVDVGNYYATLQFGVMYE